MSHYVLAIDAGGTKTQGLLKQFDSDKNWTIKLGPGSLTNDFTSACNNIKETADQLLNRAGCSASDTVLVCGAAGVNNRTLKVKLEAEFASMNFSKLIITTDAHTSLYGAGGGAPVIVVALGTGSVAMRLDQSGYEKQFGGWGFVAGDQGGGANIGRELVAEILQEFDKDSFQADLFISEVLKIIGSDRQSILSWLNAVTPAQFAELCPLIYHAKGESKLAKRVLERAVNAVESLVLLSQGNNTLPVCLTGGLAKFIQPMLNNEIQSMLVPAKGGAIDGALYLGMEYLGRQYSGDKTVG